MSGKINRRDNVPSPILVKINPVRKEPTYLPPTYIRKAALRTKQLLRCNPSPP